MRHIGQMAIGSASDRRSPTLGQIDFPAIYDALTLKVATQPPRNTTDFA